MLLANILFINSANIDETRIVSQVDAGTCAGWGLEGEVRCSLVCGGAGGGQVVMPQSGECWQREAGCSGSPEEGLPAPGNVVL